MCADDYFQESDFTCTKYSDNIFGLVVAVVAVIVAILITSAGVTYMYLLSTEREETNSGYTARFLRRLPLNSVNIIIVAWQILTQVSGG